MAKIVSAHFDEFVLKNTGVFIAKCQIIENVNCMRCQ